MGDDFDAGLESVSNEKKLSWASVGLSSETAVEFPTLERSQRCKELKGTTCLKVTGKHVACVFLHRVQTPPAGSREFHGILFKTANFNTYRHPARDSYGSKSCH